MAWFIPVILKVLVSNGIGAWMLKRTAQMGSRRKRLVVQFLFCAMVAVGIAALTGRMVISKLMLIAVVLGIINSIAVLFQWSAIGFSLSRTSLFTFCDDMIAMGLGLIFLGETAVLNAGVIVGTLLSLAVVSVFTVYVYRRASAEGKDHRRVQLAFIGSVLVYSVIWGFAMFMFRYMGLSGLDTETFLAGWYSGSLIGALIIVVMPMNQQGSNRSLAKREIIWMLALSCVILTALAFSYLSYQQAPIAVVQPIFLVGEMILPAFIGFYMFHERKTLDAVEKALFALGFIAVLIIAVSY